MVAMFSLVLIAACDPGVYVDPELTDAGAAADSAPAADTNTTAACEEPSTALPNGRHNAGASCAACHSTGVGAKKFTLAGTLYASKTGVGSISGATIIVTDANGGVHKLISAANGNFYATEPLAYPVTVSVSKCPDTVPMVSPVTSGGDCNAGGCHALNAPSGRVHLP
jgi:hypothetical protein